MPTTPTPAVLTLTSCDRDSLPLDADGDERTHRRNRLFAGCASLAEDLAHACELRAIPAEFSLSTTEQATHEELLFFIKINIRLDTERLPRAHAIIQTRLRQHHLDEHVELRVQAISPGA